GFAHLRFGGFRLWGQGRFGHGVCRFGREGLHRHPSRGPGAMRDRFGRRTGPPDTNAPLLSAPCLAARSPDMNGASSIRGSPPPENDGRPAVQENLKMLFRSFSMSSSVQPLARLSSLMRSERAVSSILRSPKERSLSPLRR